MILLPVNGQNPQIPAAAPPPKKRKEKGQEADKPITLLLLGK